MHAHTDRSYLPAAGHDWFLPLYDPLTKLLGFDSSRRRLLEQAALEPHHRVLDVGCGTGTLAVLIKRLYPAIEVTALDPDPRALARAKRKAARASAAIRFDTGFSDALPYRDGTFDRVFSSMMLHHIAPDEKDRALGEMRRVLQPGGRLELLDFETPSAHAHGVLSRVIHSHHRLKDNSEGRIVQLLSNAGFANVAKLREEVTLAGRVAYFEARVPEVGP